jgi:hypothetical protein
MRGVWRYYKHGGRGKRSNQIKEELGAKIGVGVTLPPGYGSALCNELHDLKQYGKGGGTIV